MHAGTRLAIASVQQPTYVTKEAHREISQTSDFLFFFYFFFWLVYLSLFVSFTKQNKTTTGHSGSGPFIQLTQHASHVRSQERNSFLFYFFSLYPFHLVVSYVPYDCHLPLWPSCFISLSQYKEQKRSVNSRWVANATLFFFCYRHLVLLVHVPLSVVKASAISRVKTILLKRLWPLMRLVQATPFEKCFFSPFIAILEKQCSD